MKYRKLGTTDVQVSALALGAWAIGGWMWGGTNEKEAIEAINKSIELGITTIDTAPIYGFGKSEEIVGKAISSHRREDLQILTKYGLRWDTDEGLHYFDSEDANGTTMKIQKFAGADSIIYECEQSLIRLNTDYIDLYQIHWPDVTTPIEETMKAVDKLLKAGKIRAAGVSNYSVAQMKTAETVVKLASNQVPYSMVERSIEKELVPYAIENKKSIIAYSPLQRGLLTGKITPQYTFGKGDHRAKNVFFGVENRKIVAEFLEKIKPIAEKYQVTLAQLVLNWTAHRPTVDCILAGARNEKQAYENAQALDFEITENEMQKITQLIDNVKLNFF